MAENPTSKNVTTESPKEPGPGQKLLDESLRRQQSEATLFTIAIVLFVSAALAVLFARDLAEVFTASYRRDENLASNTATIRIIGALIGIASLGVMTFLYTTGFSFAKLKRTAAGAAEPGLDFKALSQMLDAISRAADDIRTNRFVTDTDRNVISEEIEGLVRKSLPKEFFVKVDEKYGATVVNHKISKYIEEFMESTKDRLARFQEDLSRKAASSLAWGLVTAAFGLIILALFIYMHAPGTMDPVTTVFYFVTRMGLVAIIEIVAFFFLSQYRFTLLDEKYVNNEITNAELRLLALIVSAKMGKQNALDKILYELARTERNFALKKGEVSIFHSGSGGDLLQSAAVAGLLSKLVPTPDRSSGRKEQKG